MRRLGWVGGLGRRKGLRGSAKRGRVGWDEERVVWWREEETERRLEGYDEKSKEEGRVSSEDEAGEERAKLSVKVKVVQGVEWSEEEGEGWK
jgi:hypothetical protein